MKTPSATIVAYAKTSWFTAGLLNNLIMNLDSNGQATEYNMMVSDATLPRIYWGGKCSRINMSRLAGSRMLQVTMDFLFMGGDNQYPAGVTLPTFTAPSAPDVGELVDVGAVTFANTATTVQSWSLTLMRGSAWRYDDNSQSVFPTGIASGMFGGIFSMDQSPLGTIPSTGVTIDIGSIGAGVSIQLALSEDNTVLPQRAAVGNETTSWTLYNSATGLSPIIISPL
jgi:hypothetical protein